MEFQLGDDVVHPGYGVGNIVRCEERQLAGAAMQLYYVLAIDTATVWVPVRADGLTNLRSVTARNELEEYRLVLKSRPIILAGDHNKRRLEIYERLRPGSFQSMCEVVRDLTARGWFRPISGWDATQLQKVLDNLLREWAVAAGLSLREAAQEVEALLQAGRDVHAEQHVTAQP